MKILFTLFTPPFSQTNSSYINFFRNPEVQYLEYKDWSSNLRRNFAKKDNVKFISFSLGSNITKYNIDNYEAIFFPIETKIRKIDRIKKYYPNIRSFYSEEMIKWIQDFDPDIIHMIGTGFKMNKEIIKISDFSQKSFVWERVVLNESKREGEDVKKCKYLVLPTGKTRIEAQKFFPKEKLVNFPLGANIKDFSPSKTEKRYDVVSVGHLGTRKQIHIVRKLVKNNNLSWIHGGGIVEDWPFNKIEDFVFFNRIKRILGLRRVKKSLKHNHVCGFFPNSKMAEIYNQSKVLVHPSLAEGAPRCVQEALACEVPVIVLKETVPYIEPEFGIACNSLDEIEDATMSLLSDDKKRKTMGKRGREWLIEHHSPQKMHEEIEKYHKITAQCEG